MSIVDKDIAYSGIAGSVNTTPLFAGQQDVVTEAATVALNTTLVKYQVVARNADGDLVPHAPAAGDVTAIPVGITTQAVVTTTAKGNVAIYTAGYFNYAAITWHASITTLALAKAVFRASTVPGNVNINIGTVAL